MLLTMAVEHSCCWGVEVIRTETISLHNARQTNTSPPISQTEFNVMTMKIFSHQLKLFVIPHKKKRDLCRYIAILQRKVTLLKIQL